MSFIFTYIVQVMDNNRFTINTHSTDINSVHNDDINWKIFFDEKMRTLTAVLNARAWQLQACTCMYVQHDIIISKHACTCSAVLIRRLYGHHTIVHQDCTHLRAL